VSGDWAAVALERCVAGMSDDDVTATVRETADLDAMLDGVAREVGARR
jgi:hypothetical protein